MQVERCIKGSISSKQPGWEGLLAGLIAEACIQVCPKNKVGLPGYLLTVHLVTMQAAC